MLQINIPSKKKKYDIIIDHNILDSLGIELKKRNIASRYVIITDTTVNKLYTQSIQTNLKADVITITPGEKSKSRKVKETLEDNLINLGINRDTCLIALGGGVVGDLVGFVAATMYRGIPFVQVPTTLLAMVDSSIGGKVAINHPKGKNLIGAFHQPVLVYTDIATLSTLPKEEILNGLAEIIKHGLVRDEKFFKIIERNQESILKLEPTIIKRIIMDSCKIKASIVEQDEKEGGIRKILNYGHTFGHALEKLSNNKIQHGKAVGLGMFIASHVANQEGILSKPEMEKQNALLRKLGYIQSVSYPSQKIIDIMKLDKKSRDGQIEYVLLKGIGKAKINIKIADKSVRQVLSHIKFK